MFEFETLLREMNTQQLLHFFLFFLWLRWLQLDRLTNVLKGLANQTAQDSSMNPPTRLILLY